MRTELRMTVAICVRTGNTSIMHDKDVVCPIEERDRLDSAIFEGAVSTMARQVYEMLRATEPQKEKGSAT